MRFKKIVKLFNDGNVCVTGVRGTGKDLIFGNVIARKRGVKSYVSNLNYGGDFYPLDFNKIDCNGNTFEELISGDLYPYEFPYPMGSDIYLSDAGIYLPSQFCNKLNERYKGIATYQALSRQLSANNFHCNSQNLNRIFDKIREQSDTYIRCRKCIYLFGLVIQFITIYDKAQSCIDRVNPCRVKKPLFSNVKKVDIDIYKDNFYNTHGTVENRILIYFNRSKHDTIAFRELMKNGKKEKPNQTKTKN